MNQSYKSFYSCKDKCQSGLSLKGNKMHKFGKWDRSMIKKVRNRRKFDD